MIFVILFAHIHQINLIYFTIRNECSEHILQVNEAKQSLLHD